MSKTIVEIEGFAELRDKLQKLGNDKAMLAEMRGVLRKVAQSTVKAARQQAPVAKRPHWIGGKRSKKKLAPGNLKKSIGVITGKKGSAKSNPVVYVGPRVKGSFMGFYGAMVHDGHNVYREGFKRKHSSSSRAKAHNASGAKTRTRANPFMERAYSQTKGQVTPEAEKSVAAYIQKRIDKLSNKS